MGNMTIKWVDPDSAELILFPRQTYASGVVGELLSIGGETPDFGQPEMEIFEEPIPYRSGYQWFGAVEATRDMVLPLYLFGQTREHVMDEIRTLNRLFRISHGKGGLFIERKAANQTTDVKCDISCHIMAVPSFRWSPSEAAEGLFGRMAPGYPVHALYVIRLHAPYPYFRDTVVVPTTYEFRGTLLSDTLSVLGNTFAGTKVEVTAAGAATPTHVIFANGSRNRGWTLSDPNLSSTPAVIDWHYTDPGVFQAYRGGTTIMPKLDFAADGYLQPGDNAIEIWANDDADLDVYFRNAYSSI